MEEKIVQQKKNIRKIPVILDTDIGTDIDDVWALIMMLNSPELDVKLIVTDFGNTTYRAKIAAKLLECAGRTEIPIGIGLKTSEKLEAQEPWIRDYDLDAYPGTIYKDGVEALINTIMSAEEQITLIAIGPVTNLALALEKQPKIAEHVRFVGMQGALRKGYDYADGVGPECNVSSDPIACKKVFTAPWDMTITPLDTCGLVSLKGDKYKKVLNSDSIMAKALVENFKVWYENRQFDTNVDGFETQSTVLFDTVAIYLAFSEEYLVMEELGVRIDDNNCTVIDPNAKKMKCATEWKDLEKFEDSLLSRIIK